MGGINVNQCVIWRNILPFIRIKRRRTGASGQDIAWMEQGILNADLRMSGKCLEGAIG